MEDLPLYLSGLLGGTVLVCYFAEFLLRLFECKRAPLETPASSHVGTEQMPGILIVADHFSYRKILRTWFLDHGFSVWLAADGREAIKLHHAHAKGIALALLDVCMPGLDGPETLAVLRQEAPSLPCCFMTANLATRQKTQLLSLGAARVFEKPLPLREATEVIWGLIKNGKH